MLQSAIGYCQRAGLQVQAANLGHGLVLMVPGVMWAPGGEPGARAGFCMLDEYRAVGLEDVPISAPAGQGGEA